MCELAVRLDDRERRGGVREGGGLRNVQEECDPVPFRQVVPGGYRVRRDLSIRVSPRPPFAAPYGLPAPCKPVAYLLPWEGWPGGSARRARPRVSMDAWGRKRRRAGMRLRSTGPRRPLPRGPRCSAPLPGGRCRAILAGPAGRGRPARRPRSAAAALGSTPSVRMRPASPVVPFTRPPRARFRGSPGRRHCPAGWPRPHFWGSDRRLRVAGRTGRRKGSASCAALPAASCCRSVVGDCRWGVGGAYDPAAAAAAAGTSRTFFAGGTCCPSTSASAATAAVRPAAPAPLVAAGTKPGL